MSRLTCQMLRRHLAACRSKRAYRQEEKAKQETERIGAITGIRLHVYRCPMCSWWHMTKCPQPKEV